MKTMKIYIIGFAAFTALLVWLNMHAPQRFIWDPTYAHIDKNPFGCAAFDSVMGQTLRHGYSVSTKSLHELSLDTTPQTVLMLGRMLNLSKKHADDIDRILKRGGNVVMVAQNSLYVNDSLLKARYGMCMSDGYRYFNLSTLRKQLADKNPLAFINLYCVKQGGYDECKLRILRSLVSASVTVDDSIGGRKVPYMPLAYVTDADYYASETDDDEWEADSVDVDSAMVDDVASDMKQPYDTLSWMAVERNLYRGKLIMASTPLLFTNYGILDRAGNVYLMRLMSRVGNVPVVRMDGDAELTINGERKEPEAQSPLHFFLQHPPLRWAIYLTLATVLLFYIVTARRRQRVIPVVRGKRESELEFARLVSKLYLHCHDNADLVCKKRALFADALRSALDVDIFDRKADAVSVATIAACTGQDAERIKALLLDLRLVGEGEVKMSDKEMKRLIDQMNEIIKKL